MNHFRKPLAALLSGIMVLGTMTCVQAAASAQQISVQTVRTEQPASVQTVNAQYLAGAQPAATAEQTTVQTVKAASEAGYSYKTETKNKTCKGKNSTITVKHSYKRVVLAGSGDAEAKINAQLKKYSDSFMKNTAAYEAAKEACKNRKENDTYKDYTTQKVTFLSDTLVSIETVNVWYAGGVSNKTVSGYTFSLKTGKRVTKLTSVTKTSSLAKIKSSLKKKITAAKLDPEALEDKTTANFSFYVAESGKVVVCFAPYELNQGGDSVSYTLSGKYESVKQPTSSEDPAALQKLYEDAVKDAVFADTDEICPLVTIDKNSDMVTWNKSGDRVLLLTWHKYPDSYPAGKEVTTKWGEVWTFTDKEMVKWYKTHKDEMKNNPTLRLEQLIGLPAGKNNTTVTAFWADPKDVVRPAYVTDITAQMKNTRTENSKDADFNQWYTQWFDGNIIWSYFDSAYPWTRLGYTYDWADNGQEYGLSEFLVRKDSKVDVEFTMTTDEFLKWLDQQ